MEVRTVARQLPCRDRSALLEEYVASLSNAEPVQQPAVGVVADMPGNSKIGLCSLRQVE